jgi:hypothetical protein
MNRRYFFFPQSSNNLGCLASGFLTGPRLSKPETGILGLIRLGLKFGDSFLAAEPKYGDSVSDEDDFRRRVIDVELNFST